MAAEWTDWRIVQLEPIAEIFIVCPCRNELRLVDDRPTTCATCGRQYVMTLSLIGREKVEAAE